MMQPPETPPQKRPIWQYLVAPMLAVSVGLHGILLLLPTGASDDELVPAPDPEEDGITITRVESPNAQIARNGNNSAATDSSSLPSRRNSTANASRQNANSNRGSSGSALASGSRSGSSKSLSRARSSRESDTTSQNASASDSSSAAEESSNSRQDNSTDSQIAASDPRVALLDYWAVFETYRGPVSVEAEEILELKGIWLSGLKEDNNQLVDIEVEDIEPLRGLAKIPYPAAICLPEVPATAQLLVLVDSEGIPNRDIFPIKDTGYTSFDDQAESVIRAHTFPEQASAAAYLVEVEVAYDPDNCQWPPSVEGVPNEFWTLLKGYIGPALTSPDDAEAEEERWRSRLSLPEPTPLPDFEATVSYDLELCLPISPTPAQFGIIVQPDGNLQDEPQLLRSTGYKQLDSQAQQLLDLFAFTGSDAPQVHVLTVSVDYNPLLCRSLSVQVP